MKKILLSICLLSLFTSCDDLLDTYPYGQIDDDKMPEYQTYVKGLVGYAYEQMPRDYRNIQGNRLDCATDDAVLTSLTDNVTRFATGTVNNSQDPFSATWTSYYKAIANLNLFLKDDMGYNTHYYLDEETDERYRKLLQGEAYGMRAMMEWTLLKYWGGKGMKSGELLGFPIITEKITVNTSDVDRKRNTYAECVEQIQKDCDEALKYLPDAHRDFLLTGDDVNYKNVIGSCNWGRIDGMSVKAILADMYLTYASPLFNPNNDAERWKKAAEYAKEVMDMKDRIDGPHGFNKSDALNWADAYSPSAIFVSRRISNSDATDATERDFYPAGYQGNGILGATEDLVDAFPAKNGFPITDERSNYDAASPYANRDLRLARDIFYPGSKNTKGYVFEAWADGKDAPGLSKVSRTGYHINKMVYPDLKWTDASPKKGPHVKYYYRWENVALMFAEAANEYEGPDGNTFGLSAKEALEYVRKRNVTTTVASPYKTSDPYLSEMADKGKDSFRELIHNERRIELCFEGSRFFDVRRWNTNVAAINKPVHMISVVKNEDGSFTYTKTELDQRVFPSLYIPIPYDETMRASNMEQNEGWEKWSR